MKLLSVSWWWKLLFSKHHHREGPLHKREETEDCTSIIVEDGAAANLKVPRKFSFQELQRATNSFDQGNRSDNPAYFRGKPACSGKNLLVKRVETSKQNRRFVEQFTDELSRISGLQHKNLVELRGYCLHRSSFFLVYQDSRFIGCLDTLLLKTSSERVLVSWASRLQIIQDVARGIAHLHANKVLHLDIKPENVFVDAEMHARVVGFGFSKLEKKSSIKGTPSYMPPEWLQMRVSEKTDVYSFGMLLFEVVSGMQLVHSKQQMKMHLGTWAFQMAHRDELRLMIDPGIAKEVRSCGRRVEDVIRVGLWCIQADARLRPSMSSTLRMLRGEVEVLDPPLPPPPPEGGVIDMDFSLSVVMEMMHLQQPLKKNRFFKLL